MALCEVLQGLADPHAGPVEGPSQGDENQEQQHGPRGIDSLVGLSLHPRSSLQRNNKQREHSGIHLLPTKPFQEGHVSSGRARHFL